MAIAAKCFLTKRETNVYHVRNSYSMWQDIVFALWGCVPELGKDCPDMTNASSTYLGIAIGALVGGLVSWWIYNRQKKTSENQDIVLEHIEKLNQRHDAILKRLEKTDKRNELALNTLLDLNKKIEHIIEMQDKLHSSIRTGLTSRNDNNPAAATETKNNQE